MFNGIVANPDVLEEEFIPPSLPCRESQKDGLAFCLSPIQKNSKPLDCLCYGKPGTGKTALVKHLLQQINENTRGFGFYVNCWEKNTLNLILEEICKQAGIVVTVTSYQEKLGKLRSRLKNMTCVVALDEVDKLPRKDLNDILYMLKSFGKFGVICISNHRNYFLKLDDRIVSRVSLDSNIYFPPYSDEELLTILKHRIVDCKALYPNVCPKNVLEKIVELANGDARIAIQTLKTSAYNAEKQGKIGITLEDVKEGYEHIKEIKKKYQLEKLRPHHKLIVEVVKKNGVHK